MLRDQKRVLFVAAVPRGGVVLDLRPSGQVARRRSSSASASASALVNHIVSEYSLLKTLASGREPTRSRCRQALVRLLAVGGGAAAVAVVFWSTGIVTLIGLALFRLITLVMTSIPLLKELKQHERHAGHRDHPG